jgi:RecJ-like exonuclease
MMGATNLIKAALHPGTSLKHHGERVSPVDALQALARAPQMGSVLLHARLGQDNLVMLRAVVNEVAMNVFEKRNWTVGRRRYVTVSCDTCHAKGVVRTPAGVEQPCPRCKGKRSIERDRMDLFVDQIWREYMGEPCHRCRGYGYVGRKFDTLRHKLDKCRNCGGGGYRLRPVREPREGDEYHFTARAPVYLRVPCDTCHGKGLSVIVEELKARRLSHCPECFGSGSVAASLRARAKAIRFDAMHVSRVWLERFRVVLMTLRDLERAALVVIRDQLYGPDSY